MKDKLLPVLHSFGYPVYLQGTLNPEEVYPDSFITFWTDYTTDNGHYDNGVHSVDWSVSVFFYSNDPALVNKKPFEIAAALRFAGFIPQGRGHDLASDEPTHTGWVSEYIYNEIQ